MMMEAGILGESTVFALAHMNQLGIWSGEAVAMHLARLSDPVIPAVAARRAAGQPFRRAQGWRHCRNCGWLREPAHSGKLSSARPTPMSMRSWKLKDRNTAGRKFVLQKLACGAASGHLFCFANVL